MGRENFDSWKKAAQSYLIIKGLCKWCQNEPSASASAQGIADNEKAKAELTLLLEETNYSYVAEDDTAKKAWQNITKAFEDSGLSRKVSLLQQLVSLKLNDCVSMEEYVN